jgi:hypothetical protein
MILLILKFHRTWEMCHKIATQLENFRYDRFRTEFSENLEENGIQNTQWKLVWYLFTAILPPHSSTCRMVTLQSDEEESSNGHSHQKEQLLHVRNKIPPERAWWKVLTLKPKETRLILICFRHDSSVGIALGYGLDDWGSRVRFPAWAGNFSLHHRVQNGSGAHSASYTMGTRRSFPGVKRLVREADHSPPSSAEIKNEWSYTSTPQYVFMAWCLIKPCA